jgi:hypothetical protein
MKSLDQRLGELVALAKGALDSRRVWEPSRKRWLALCERAKKIDAALALRA